MKLRTIQFILFCFLFSSFAHGQIRFSETIQTSKIANSEKNTLYFIDFWATWCGPCVYANEYLEVLQKQYPNDFYVVSLSEENPDKVKRHLSKKPTELAVAIDYNGETFDDNNIRTLPYGILLNANGKILWKGSPSNFKASMLEKYLGQHSKQVSYDEIFKIESPDSDIKTVEYIPKSDFEIESIKNLESETLEVYSKKNYREIKGDLMSILTHELRILPRQIEMPSELNKNYHVFIDNDEDLLARMSSYLNIELLLTEKTGEVLKVNNSEGKFWDTNQINWGENTARYLIDDTQIQADNVSLNAVMSQLSLILDIPIVMTNTSDTTQTHDWIIHHKFFSLMQSDLLDNFGLSIEKQNGTYEAYIVTKKAP